MNKKGTFSSQELSVSKKYLFPKSGKVIFLAGIGVAAIVVVYAALSLIFMHGRFLSAGAVSSNHASFEQNCEACHTPLAEVNNDKCSVCHEKYGDELGNYTFSAHYLYRSDDFRRLVPSAREQKCATCHMEHLGREALIGKVPDSECLACHEIGSFNDGHPQFQFVTNEGGVEVSNLRFPHVKHVEELQRREGILDIERTCFYCHKPEASGEGFQPISFEQSCDACHLTTSSRTPWLKMKNPRQSGSIGVLSPQALRASSAPGLRWIDYVNLNEFQERGGTIRKSPLYHEDPWILENLKSLRKLLYPNTNLADLLKTSGDIPPNKDRELYKEALATLKEYAVGLRARPEAAIRRELDEINDAIAMLERRIAKPYSALDPGQFSTAGSKRNRQLTASQLTTIENLVNDLTESCRKCHLVENATILRVQKDQKTMRRAEFSHSAHILQRRCLECHAGIPIAGNPGKSSELDASTDRAQIQNLPTIEVCQQCHQPGKSANSCISCHRFHPNRNIHTNLLLYVD